jgi:hypothetical protein
MTPKSGKFRGWKLDCHISTRKTFHSVKEGTKTTFGCRKRAPKPGTKMSIDSQEGPSNRKLIE